jgi:hypothetical protein
VVGWAEPGPVSSTQDDLLKQFAAQAVIAIENVRLFEAEQQRTRELSEALAQQAATSEVLQVISSSPGQLKPVFQAMLENAVRICEAKFGNMYLRDGEVFRLAAVHNTPLVLVEQRKRAPLRPAGLLGRMGPSRWSMSSISRWIKHMSTAKQGRSRGSSLRVFGLLCSCQCSRTTI